MDIVTNLAEQLKACSDFLRLMARDESPPSKEYFQEWREGFIEHADFIDRYTTPKVVRLLNGEKLSIRAQRVQVDPNPTFVGSVGDEDEAVFASNGNGPVAQR